MIVAAWRYILFLTLSYYKNVRGTEQRTCTGLEGISMCEPLGYVNVTLPNPRGHTNQYEADKELADFGDLVASGCSLYLRHFLCAYYAPLCRVYLPVGHKVLPCRELCTHVRERCEPLMVSNGTHWPDHLQCELFPYKTDVPWCFGPESDSQIQEDAVITSTSQILPAFSIQASPTISKTDLNTEAAHLSPTTTPNHQEKCEQIPLDNICGSLGYSQAKYPNTLGHSSMEEAETKLQTSVNIFLYYSCSPLFLPLLCHYYHPECSGDSPCQEMCVQVKGKCSSTMNKWPKELDCSRLPSVNNTNTVCRMAESYNETTPSVVGVDVGGGSTINTTEPLIIIFCFFSIFIVLSLSV